MLLRKIFLAIIFIVPVWFSSVYAGVYYVAPDGGTGAGTKNNPWSLNYANLNLKAGDTAKLLPGTYLDQVIIPAASGTSETNRIVYEASDMNNKPEFRSSKRSAPYLIDLTNRNYITVSGIRADGKGIYLSSKFNKWILFDNSKYNIIEDSVFERSKGYSAIIFRTSKYNKILRNVFSENGTWDKFPWRGNHDDSGSAMWIYRGSEFNLIQENLFRRSGHDLGIIEGSYNVIRKNIYDNDWGVYAGPAFTWKQGDIQPGDRIGNRTVSIKKGSRNLVEENIFMNVPESVDNSRVPMLNVAGKNQIVRKNILVNGIYGGMSSSVGSAMASPIGNKIYNNTLYDLGGPVWTFEAYNSDDLAPIGSTFKNNIAYKFRTSPYNRNQNVDFHFKTLNTYYGDQFLNNKITFNCIAKDATASDQKINAEVTGIESLSYYENNNPSLINNNAQVNPGFVNEKPAIPDFESASNLLDTALRIRETVRNAVSLKSSSKCIDKGGNLTNTLSSGSNSKVISVADAGYFSDGFGLINGDDILIGLTPARITNVNLSTNQITVDSAISWSRGDPVNLMFSGKRPDPGAIEFARTNKNPMALNDSVTTKQNLIVTIDVLANDTDPDNGDNLSVSAVTQGANGAVTNNIANVTYTPDVGFSGSDSFSYTISDGSGGSDTARVNVTVTSILPPNPPSGNLLSNGGFEKDRTAWNSINGSTKSIVGSPVRSGSKAFKTLADSNSKRTGVYFTEDFESTSLNPQHRLTCRDAAKNFAIQKKVVRAGEFAAHLKKGIVGKRCEVTVGKLGNHKFGQEVWYGFSFNIPIVPEGYGLIHQHHAVPGPIDKADWNFAAGTNGFSLRVVDNGKFVIVLIPPGEQNKNINGTEQNPFKGSAGRGSKIYYSWPIETNKWFDVVMNFRYSDKSDGFFKIWVDGVKVVDITGSNVHLHDVAGRLKPRRYYTKYGVYLGPDATGEIYYDEIRFGDKASSYEDVAPSQASAPVDTKAPSQPLKLTASATTQTTTKLRWEASTDDVGVVSYDVYRGSALVETVIGTTVDIPGLKAGTSYSFRVQAEDAAGNVSGFSQSISVKTLADFNTPGNLLSNGGFESGRTAWNSINGSTKSIVSSPVRNGSKALRSRGNLRWVSVNSKPVEITADSQYTFSSWIKSSNITESGASAYMQVRFYRSNGSEIQGTRNLVGSRIRGTRAFTRVRETITAPSAATQLRIYLQLARTAGTAQYDDVSVMSSQ